MKNSALLWPAAGLTLVVSWACWGPGEAPAAKELPAPSAPARDEVQEFLNFYSSAWVELYTVAAEQDWVAGTDVSAAHTAASVAANQTMGAFAGNGLVIRKTKEFLARKDISDLQRRQLTKILLKAAETPGTLPEVVAKRLAAEGAQRNALDGFDFKMQDASGALVAVTPNDIDGILVESRNLDERRRAWEAAKTVGVALKPGLVELQSLRNAVAKEMGHNSFFSLQVADYGMSSAEMMALMDQLLADIQPLYEQLHCYAKHRLAERYGQPVPRRIPAHWLGNRWAQEWPGLADGVAMDALFEEVPPQDLIAKAEAFYVSMGFPKLPQSFWDKSDLYDLPAGSLREKNKHASAWHMNLRDDVRSLMSVQSDYDWFLTTHHELGHIYYYMSYSRPQVPYLLREGANRAYHEGIGELISLAAGQQPYMRAIGLLPADQQIDQVQWQLDEAMKSIVFLPWSAGVMSHFEHDLYEQPLPANEFNQRWWQYVAQYQGVEAPTARGEEFCDAATKTHISDDPAQYYDYALATVIKFQLHDHIARKILHQDPRSANYLGSKEAGDFLRSLLSQGATRDWRELLREATGEDLSGRALLEYYQPLLLWLREQNKGLDTSFR